MSRHRDDQEQPDHNYIKGGMYSEKKTSNFSVGQTSVSEFKDKQQKEDLIIFLKGKVSSLEKQLENLFFQYNNAVGSGEKTNINIDLVKVKSREQVKLLTSENMYLKKALLWRKQEMELFESKFKGFFVHGNN